MEKFLEQYHSKITGILSAFDRMIDNKVVMAIEQIRDKKERFKHYIELATTTVVIAMATIASVWCTIRQHYEEVMSKYHEEDNLITISKKR